ncbi:YegP family protein [Lysobacter yananisis]|uniref:YegP family protein n=1 Tax=Lysobacter yananisis TaxID=1003114 RepID=UPI003CE5C794
MSETIESALTLSRGSRFALATGNHETDLAGERYNTKGGVEDGIQSVRHLIGNASPKRSGWPRVRRQARGVPRPPTKADRFLRTPAPAQCETPGQFDYLPRVGP